MSKFALLILEVAWLPSRMVTLRAFYHGLAVLSSDLTKFFKPATITNTTTKGNSMIATKHDTLTIQTLLNLADIAEAAIQTKRVRYLLPDSGALVTGTVRSIGDDVGYFLRNDEDVRDGFLRITLDTGFEVFIPMADVTLMVRRGTMVFGNF